MSVPFRSKAVLVFVFGALILSFSFPMQDTTSDPSLDRRVKDFLDSRTGQWHDMNVPSSDGQFFYDLVVEHKYKKVLEIGTSTGYSGIWIAWALSKTGGKLITIEIDESRYRKALENFKSAGLSDFIDARLADAHDLVPKMEGPFDFVFCDADKEWTTNYFTAVSSKLLPGGCFAVHNALISRGNIPEFLTYIKNRSDFKTTIEQSRSTGISLSFRKTGPTP
jgi:caffeoyl-CoA O-methyltransferase